MSENRFRHGSIVQRRGMGLQGGIAVLLLIGALGIVLEGCSSAAKTRRINVAEAHYKVGISHLNENELQLAYIEFQKAVEVNPKGKKAYYAIGHIFFVQENYTEAAEAFKKALRVDKKYSDAHNYLGMVYERLRNHELAVMHFKRALQNPQYVTPEKAHYNLGRNYVQLGKIDEAISEFQASVRVAPAYAPGFNALGKALVRKEHYGEAVKAFNNALKISPNIAEARFFLGESYLKTGSADLAAEEFKQVIQIAPDSEMARSAQKKLESLR